jgi:hypothetical protein
MKRDAWRRENEKTGLIAGSDTYDTYRLGNLYPLLQGREAPISSRAGSAPRLRERDT